MKRIIALILTAALTAVAVLACATDGEIHEEPGRTVGDAEIQTNGETNGGTAEVPVAELRFPDLPEIDFGGYEFRILGLRAGAMGHILTQLVAEEETGEALNDAIFRRNRRMEDRFGFHLVKTNFNYMGPVRDAARRSIQAASDDFDLAMLRPEHALAMAQEGMLEMIDRIPHIDLSQPWWDQAKNRDFSIGGRVFFTSGDFSFNQYSVTIATFFNKQLHADLGLGCPYTLVREGRWTLERFAEQARTGLRDLNGDGIFDQNDQWGYLAQAHVYTFALMAALGTRFTVKDADDMPVLNMNTEGFISRFHTLFDILSEGWLFDPTARNIPGGGEFQQNMFLNDQGLFITTLMNWAITLRAMDNDFGILPQPKLNEQQPYHITGVDISHAMSIPVTTSDLQRTGIILEALNAESRLTTLDVYYDTMLVNQVLNRDEESAEMLDIIFGNRVYDMGRHFWDSNIADPVRLAFRDGNRDIVSIIERREPAAVAAINTAIQAFLD